MSRYSKALKKRSREIISRLRNAYYLLFAPHKGTLNQYNSAFPHPQHILNLFENEWVSSFPHPFQSLKAGVYPLFEDARIEWGIQQLGGVENQKILELGPLEGGHSYMLQKQGAASIVAVEANPRAYLRCLVVKQLMKLERVDFLFGDFNEYLRHHSDQFDMCFASGVLYHMKNPIELLALMAKKSRGIFLWTQYYDPEICSTPSLKSKFLAPHLKEVEGFKHALYPFKYGSSRSWSTFIGGPAKTSCWLTRQDILKGLHHFGFTKIHINFEKVDASLGPSFSLVAQKESFSKN